MRLLLWVIAIAIMAGCASIGRPEGGPRDERPPEFVRSNPAPRATRVTPTRLEIFFNENIQLDDAFNKVIVSPTQKFSPTVRSLGRRVTVDLRDTLLDNTTYTIDFGDAIKDLNEGNILDGFAMEFATGDSIDSLRVSGIVLAASNLEPAQGVLVGVHSDLSDTALTTKPFDRVARTNQYGQFTVRGLKPGLYNVFALNDVNRDNRWDRSEDVAFLGTTVSPTVEAIVVNDTLRDAADLDSIVSRPGVAYLPADVLLTWFNEDYRAQYLSDYKRPDRQRVTLTLGAPADSLPTARVVLPAALAGTDVAELTLTEASPTNDTLTWWLRDPRLYEADTLSLAVTYPRTDSLSAIVMRTDTLKFNIRPTKDEVARRKARAEGTDTVAPPVNFATMRMVTSSRHEIYQPIIFELGTPIAEIDTTGIRLSMAVDTVWQPVDIGAPVALPAKPALARTIDFPREPGVKYRLEIDSAAIHDIFGNPTRTLKHELTVRTPDEYSLVRFTLVPPDTTAVVELLDGSDKPVRRAAVDASGSVTFEHVAPGKYYARLFLDTNGDGTWTTGSVADSLQPEEVAYYPKKIDARANWDIDLTWAFYETAIDRQKPRDILKNKPKLKKGEKEPAREDDEETDEWGNPIDRRGNRRDNTNPRATTSPFGGGGFQSSGGGASSGNLRR